MNSSARDCYEFGPFRLDRTERVLFRDGQPLTLTAKAFDLLLALVECHGHIIEKEELMSAVWPETAVEESNLTHHISVLRKTLGEGENGQKFIETMPRRGYRFVADVRALKPGDSDLAPQGKAEIEAPERDPAAAESMRGGISSNGKSRAVAPADLRRRVGAYAFIVLLAAILATGGVYFYKTRSGRNATDKTPISALAVMPFVNVSSNPEVEYLSDGVSESLINTLAQLPQLKVISRTSSFTYKGKAIDARKVARELVVDAIVIGRVSQRGDDLLISVELVNAHDGTQVWGQQYRSKASDLLAVQSEISRQMAAELRFKLTNDERRQLAKRETANSQAYDLLIEGRFYWNKGGTENQKKAIERYQQAIAADPAYARAYAELSISYGNLVGVSVLDPKEFMPKAEAAALKALELDEGLGEAHYALAGIRISTWNWAAAERECQRAIEVAPNLARSHSRYSSYLSLMGRHEEAIAEIKRARELDPLSLVANWEVGYRFLLARQNDQAIEVARKLIELDQNYPNSYALLGYGLEAKGQYAEAIATYQKAIKLGNRNPDLQIYLGTAYAKAGERKKARTILKQLEADKFVSPGALAALYLALGEREQALAALERAYSMHDNQLMFLATTPHFDPLRAEPGFLDLMRRVGFAQQAVR